MVQNYQAEGLGAGGQGLGPCSGSASVLPLPLRGEGRGEGRGCANPTAGTDVNITTLKSYTPDGNIAELTAVNPITGNQHALHLRHDIAQSLRFIQW